MTMSVHLQKLPEYNNIPYHSTALSQMDFIREICSSIFSIRKKYDIKARQPLQKVTIYGANIQYLSEIKHIIQDEVNVKEVLLIEDFSQINIKTVINLDAKTVAKRIGKDFQIVLKQAKAGIFTKNENGITIENHQIFHNEYSLNLEINNNDIQNYASIDGKYLIVLDLEITKDLEMEGIARDFIRMVQNTRKSQNFDITDKITLLIHFTEDNLEKEAILNNKGFISSQVLAIDMKVSQEKYSNQFSETVSFDITK